MRSRVELASCAWAWRLALVAWANLGGGTSSARSGRGLWWGLWAWWALVLLVVRAWLCGLSHIFSVSLLDDR